MIEGSTMKQILLIILLFTAVCFARVDTLRLTLNHSSKIELSNVPDTLYVEDPEVVDYDLHKPNILVVRAKSVGKTNLYVLNKNGDTERAFSFEVGYPIKDLEFIIKRLFPRSKIKFYALPNQLLVEGDAISRREHNQILEQLYALVSKKQIIDKIKYPDVVLDAPSRQINLRVRIVEIRRSVAKALGLHWDVLSGNANAPNFHFDGPTKLNYFNSAVAIPNTLQTTIKSDLLTLTGMVDLLEQDEFATTVQEPNLTVKAGESASFLVGGSVAINRAETVNFNAGTVGYQDYGIELKYKADFDKNDPKLIKLSVAPSVSEVVKNSDPNLNPDFLRKSANTVVELRSGQSIAIAGLVSSAINSRKNAVPGLSTLPFFGNAFRSEDYQREEKEIVLIITPYIVHATQNGMLQDPVDDKVVLNQSTTLSSGFIIGDDDV